MLRRGQCCRYVNWVAACGTSFFCNRNQCKMLAVKLSQVFLWAAALLEHNFVTPRARPSNSTSTPRRGDVFLFLRKFYALVVVYKVLFFLFAGLIYYLLQGKLLVIFVWSTFPNSAGLAITPTFWSFARVCLDLWEFITAFVARFALCFHFPTFFTRFQESFEIFLARDNSLENLPWFV